MKIYKVNDKLYIDLTKIVALEEIVGSYKLVMLGNTTLTLDEKEYKELLKVLRNYEYSETFGLGDK